MWVCFVRWLDHRVNWRGAVDRECTGMSDIEVMIAYLMLKVKQRDWHGVADAAMDIREMEAREKNNG
jgi:hypothetical protein